MKILLLNENPVVSKLVGLSAKKMSHDFKEANAYTDDLGVYDIIVIDGDIQEDIEKLKQKCSKLIVLTSRNQNFDIKDIKTLQKPFLPTDFLNLLNNDSLDSNTQTFIEEQDDIHEKDDDKLEEMDELSIDDLSLDEDEINQKSLSDNADNLDDLTLNDQNDQEEIQVDENVDEINENLKDTDDNLDLET
ncbi:hypothetical protein F2N14_01040, partial [Campylobacter novaezeelandiae]|nr:hypothetical protein [Campylobacter novaezeelandiae]